MSEQLTYVQLSSSINPSFWNKFTDLKINLFKLDERPLHIWGYFGLLAIKECSLPLLEVDSTSFNKQFNGQSLYVPFHGKLINKNTIEQFKECNKMDIINEEGKMLYEKIKNGDVLRDPSLLNSFLILSFADLKKYHYYYWFAFPVPKTIVLVKNNSCPIKEKFSEDKLLLIFEEYKKLECFQKAYFLLENNENGIAVCSLESKIHSITLTNKDNFYFAFYNIAQNTSEVGSQLRNYIALILHHCNFLEGQTVNFIAFTLNRNISSITCHESVIYNLVLPRQKQDYLTWVGWEKNEREKMGPRLVNLKNTLDPYVIAENSVDLNLKLMKWRVLPNIDLDKIKKLKCLLLGSGTLGCSVARTLLAWSVRNITFVDNSTVSFSNPVRQSLFTYQDSVQMKPKSSAAADNLKTIFPGINSKGFQLTIPMPGHTVGENLLSQTKENVEKLTELVVQHDVIFLLMDSRESRWLPTLLGSFYNKIVINAALGFDTYLVMRHGFREVNGQSTIEINHPEGYKGIAGNKLGCYFCNDVTAPGNSIKDRTLDQQCTVTRPGVSQIAGALAVELVMSLLQHKDGPCAPAFYKINQSFGNQDTNIEDQSILGLVPHSIRGFLSSFEHILPATQKYEQCVACSDIVLREYEKDGFEFLLKVFNSSRYLEDVTHLTEMFKEINFEDVMEFSDEDL